MTSALDPASIAFDGSGLVPVIIRDYASGAVLTLAWMNREALAKTIETREAWLCSRTRGELSDIEVPARTRQKVIRASTDCDRDAILLEVEAVGPACHTGASSCFESQADIWNLGSVMALLESRRREMPEDSSTAKLFAKGIDRILRKIGEEAVEVVIAAKGEGRQRVIEETADLLFHIGVLLVHEGIPLAEVEAELARRRKK